MKGSKSEQGYFLLEVLLASGVLALLSLSLFEGYAQQSFVSTMNQNRLEALNSLSAFKSTWTSGEGLLQEYTGTLKSGYPFKITVEKDIESHPPLEKASITVLWKDPNVKKLKSLQSYAIRIP